MQMRISLANGTKNLQSFLLVQLSLGVTGSVCMPIVWSFGVSRCNCKWHCLPQRGRIYCPLTGPSWCHSYNNPIRGNEGAPFPDHLQSSTYLLQAFEDNSGALELVRLPKLPPHTKHINVCIIIFENMLERSSSKFIPSKPKIKLLTCRQSPCHKIPFVATMQ